MKVYINKYRNHWISPYTVLEKICFWEKDKDIFYNLNDEPDHKYEKWVDRLTPISRAIEKFLDTVHPKVDHIKIDYWDTWNMDTTLSPIILPMLKQLKKTQHGYQIVDDEDVPEKYRVSNETDYRQMDLFPEKEDAVQGALSDLDQDRWNWILDEMIWSFEQLCDDDWDAKFHTGVFDRKSVPCAWDENGKPTLYESVKGPNDTSHFDFEGYTKYNDRISNGMKLFGKYYRGLWD